MNRYLFALVFSALCAGLVFFANKPTDPKPQAVQAHQNFTVASIGDIFSHY